jgi:hypothetical protein
MIILGKPQAWPTSGEKDRKISSSAPPHHFFERGQGVDLTIIRKVAAYFLRTQNTGKLKQLLR